MRNEDAVHPVEQELFGELIQIRDDLFDAFQTPANPDWTLGRSSMLTLYARTAEHPDRARFVDLLPRIDDPQSLREAQQRDIVKCCGSVPDRRQVSMEWA